MSQPLIKDAAGETRLVGGRLVLALVVVVGLALVLLVRLAYLQVASYQHFSTLSQDNRIRILAVPPTRGLIYSRDGRVLAENRPTYRLTITPEQVKDVDRTLASLAGLVDIAPDDLERFQRLRAQRRRFEAIPLRFQLSDEEVARLSVNRHRFPGVEVQAHLTRHYPQGQLAVHALGYVGRISEAELRRLDPAEYQGSSHIGKTGVERHYEDLLHGTVGVEKVETNAMGRVLRTVERSAPTPGADLFLTLDLDLQRTAVEALGEASGAVVALDPRDGDVLAFVSAPRYDPNEFVNGISQAAYAELRQGRNKPLFNRALRGQYPPGSTVKPFVGLAGLEHGTVSPEHSIECRGSYTLPDVDHRWRDWKRWGHGPVDLTEAVAQSCDVYFYDLAYNLGIDAMHDFLAKFGFGQATGIDLDGELTGVLPSREWKRRAKGETWFHGETVITGIGQGFSLTTPLQLAAATAVIANRGASVRPRLVRAVRRPGEPAPESLPATPARPPVELDEPHHWDLVTGAMESVVHGRRGTARAVGQGIGYHIAGKTGTAQVFGLPQGDEELDPEEVEEKLRDHALFIAFAPVDNPRIVVAVVVENGGSGSAVAAPVARRVIEHWMARKPAAEDTLAGGG